MRVVFTIVGDAGRPGNIITDLDVIPREGEAVYLFHSDEDFCPRRVRSVSHYPLGSESMGGAYVYVVLGPV